MDKRRTNPFFLSDGETTRERIRTQNFVRNLTNNNKSTFRGRLCDSCGISLQTDVWFCKKCNTVFCNDCSKDFSHLQKHDFPGCPICGARLDFEKGLDLNNDKEKVLRYIQSTKAGSQDEEDLIRKASRFFNQDSSYARKLWVRIKLENHAQLKLMEHKFKDKAFRTMNSKIMEYKPKTPIHNIPHLVKPAKPEQQEKVELKDTKPIDGLEVEWKEGKMTPANQKNYRSTYQDKD